MSDNNKQGAKKFWNKNAMLITLGLAVAALGTSFYIMSTFSRNTSTMEATDTGNVAKFDYVIKQTEGSDNLFVVGNKTQINIFDTVADTGIGTTGSNQKILAPGTAGYFSFLFRNKSNIPVKVTFDNLNYSGTVGEGASAKEIPIIFYFNGKYYSSLYNQSISSLGGSADNKTGADWKYYFREGDETDSSKGITLTGNMTAFQTALNEFSTNTITTPVSATRKATCFLNYDNSNDDDEDTVRIAWFYPFEARIKTGESTLEEGTTIGSGYKTYLFDKYNENFVLGSESATMEPVIRTSGIDSFGTITQADEYKGFVAANWQRTSAEVNGISWGED